MLRRVGRFNSAIAMCVSVPYSYVQKVKAKVLLCVHIIAPLLLGLRKGVIFRLEP